MTSAACHGGRLGVESPSELSDDGSTTEAYAEASNFAREPSDPPCVSILIVIAGGVLLGIVGLVLGVVGNLVASRLQAHPGFWSWFSSVSWQRLLAFVIAGSLLTALVPPVQQWVADAVDSARWVVENKDNGHAQPAPPVVNSNVLIGSYPLSVKFSGSQTFAALDLDKPGGAQVRSNDESADIIVENGQLKALHGQFVQPSAERVGRVEPGLLCAEAIALNADPSTSFHVGDLKPVGKQLCVTTSTAIAAIVVTQVTRSVADGPLGLDVSLYK